MKTGVLTFPALPLPWVRQLGLKEFDGEWALPPVVLANHALILMTRGRMGFTVGEERSVLNRGDLLLIPAGSCLRGDPPPHAAFECGWVHWAPTDRDARLSALQIHQRVMAGEALPDQEAADRLFIDALARASGNVILPCMALRKSFDEVRDCWWRASQEVQKPQYGGEVAVALRFAEVLVLISREALNQAGGKDVARPKDLPWLVQRAITAMRERYSMPLSITTLAAELRVTPQHLIRVFRKRLGLSPRSMLERIRIEQASALLRGSALSVKEVSFAVGFRDQRYFSRAFLRATGGTPSACRSEKPGAP